MTAAAAISTVLSQPDGNGEFAIIHILSPFRTEKKLDEFEWDFDIPRSINLEETEAIILSAEPKMAKKVETASPKQQIQICIDDFLESPLVQEKATYSDKLYDVLTNPTPDTEAKGVTFSDIPGLCKFLVLTHLELPNKLWHQPKETTQSVCKNLFFWYKDNWQSSWQFRVNAILFPTIFCLCMLTVFAIDMLSTQAKSNGHSGEINLATITNQPSMDIPEVLEGKPALVFNNPEQQATTIVHTSMGTVITQQPWSGNDINLCIVNNNKVNVEGRVRFAPNPEGFLSILDYKPEMMYYYSIYHKDLLEQKGIFEYSYNTAKPPFPAKDSMLAVFVPGSLEVAFGKVSVKPNKVTSEPLGYELEQKLLKIAGKIKPESNSQLGLSIQTNPSGEVYLRRGYGVKRTKASID